MTFTTVETEITTAVTDVLLAVMSGFAIAVIVRSSVWRQERQRAMVWILAFSLLALAAVTGAVLHGFETGLDLDQWLHHPLYLFLGLTVSFFAAGVLIDLHGAAVALWVIMLPAGIGVAFYGLTVINPGSFLVFIVYEAVAMTGALGAYLYLWIKHRKSFGVWMAAGIAMSMVAAGIQASQTVSAQIIWTFDHNGIYHIVQIAAVIPLMKGIVSGHKG